MIPRRSQPFSRAFWVSLTLVLLAGAIFIGWPRYVRKRYTASGNSCINNLLQIRSAKEQWALANKISSGHTITLTEEIEVRKYMIDRPFLCPAGGTYTFLPIGTPPTCSVPGHTVAP